MELDQAMKEADEEEDSASSSGSVRNVAQSSGGGSKRRRTSVAADVTEGKDGAPLGPAGRKVRQHKSKRWIEIVEEH